MFRTALLALVVCASLVSAQEATPVVAPPAAPSLPPPAVEPRTALEQRGGTWGVGYLGLSSLPGLSASGLLGIGGLGGLASLNVQVPMLGARTWFKGTRLGLELGVGVMVSSAVSTSDSVSLVGLVAVPIALVSGQHFIVHVAPDLRSGFTLTSSGLVDGTASTLELSARGAVELFFGFIGVPALSLEAGIRLGAARQAQNSTAPSPLGSDIIRSKTESYRFTTSLAGDAGSLIASTLSLKYYF